MCGSGIPLRYVTWLNRFGPGEVCTITDTGQGCVQQSSPWPWLVVGLLLLVAGIAVHVSRVRVAASQLGVVTTR